MKFICGFRGENMVNLITRMNSMDIVWRCVESHTFRGDFMATLVLRLSCNLFYHVFSIKTPDKPKF